MNETDQQTSIRMGQLQVAEGPSVLKTLLGSCIGLVLFCPRSAVGGLAHIVLPDSQGRGTTPGKFVDTAIPALINGIQSIGGNPGQLQAKIAGGANMLSSNAAVTIGDQNVAAIQRHLAACKIPIIAEHCGGIQGRKMTFYVDSGRVTIEIVGGESFDI